MENMTSAVIALVEKNFEDFRIRNGQVTTELCPFCKGGDNHDKYTFAIGLHNGAWSCLRGNCDKKGSFKEISEYFGEKFDVDSLSIKEIGKKKREYSLPNSENYSNITEKIESYFAKRMISLETVNDFGIMSDENGNIVFPFYKDAKLIYVKYRRPEKYIKGSGLPKSWQEKNTEPILYNMDNVSLNKPLIITEGEIDAMSLYEAGIHNVVSVPCGCSNMEWIDLCWDWLENFQQIILFGDNDEPGQEMVNTLMKRLGEDRCMIPPEYPELIVNGEDKGRLCKDANEILYFYGPDKLKELISKCEMVPIKGILNLASVPFADPTTIPRIFTKIHDLDDAIGGLGESQVTVFSGKRGEGKSTLNGQLALNAIQQGYKVCAYSGELSAQKFLEWIMLQAVESKYVSVKVDKRSGKKYTMVDPEIQKRIREWIDTKFFLFDNAYIDDASQQEAIIKVFTICARRYGCKLFIVD